jgi:hypothetical protein
VRRVYKYIGHFQSFLTDISVIPAFKGSPGRPCPEKHGKKFPPEQITRSLKMNGYAR